MQAGDLIFIGRLDPVSVLFRASVVALVGDRSIHRDKTVGDGKVHLTFYFIQCDGVLTLHVALNALGVSNLLLCTHKVDCCPQLLHHQRVGLAATDWRRSYHAAMLLQHTQSYQQCRNYTNKLPATSTYTTTVINNMPSWIQCENTDHTITTMRVKVKFWGCSNTKVFHSEPWQKN